MAQPERHSGICLIITAHGPPLIASSLKSNHGGYPYRPLPSTETRRKREQEKQAIRRSHGGLTTYIHAIMDALGYPLRFELAPAQDHDSIIGYRLLYEWNVYPNEVLAERAYDTNAILELLRSQAVIPSKSNRRVKRLLDRDTYKESNT